jgi:hypothetical protein
MGRPQYPNGSDLTAYLLAAGLDESFVAALDVETAAAAGVSQFEHEAGRRMLAVAGTRTFDRAMSNGVLVLGDDLASDSLAAPTVSDNGTALTLGTQARFEPMDAPGRGLPYNRVRFAYYHRTGVMLPWSVAAPVSIAGSWGYASTIPEDAWLSMLAFAGLYLFPQILQRRTGGMEAWTEADMSERYGTKPLETLKLGWQGITLGTAGGLNEQGKRVWGKYARVPMG